MLSLTAAKGDEPEVALSELEQRQTKGEAELLKFLKEQTGRSESALSKSLATPKEGVEAKKLRAACGNDDVLFKQVRPFSGLIRNDTFDRPVVIRKGSVYVTAGTDRRSSGTHYTPRSLTEPIVQYTLEPLVYVGPAEGKPKEEWKLRSAKELLDLKICDMACGSGAFLVQADRYLSERLVEAWEDAEKQHPGVPGITPEGSASSGAPNEQLIPKDTNERLSYAHRIVAQRCLYGVDKNPLAAEMAKLSLWLLTLAKYKPFTFLDHAIRCGDSLVGVSSETQLKTFSLDGQGIRMTLPNFLDMIPKILDATRLLRIRLEKIADDTVGNIEEKQRLFDNIRFQTKRLNYAADRLLAASWEPAKPTERVGLLRKALQEVDDRIRDVDPNKLEAEGRAHREVVGCPQPLHWPLEFPEVFLERGGFDAFVCNPPFSGVRLFTAQLGKAYGRFLYSRYKEASGNVDLSAFFLRTALDLMNSEGCSGLIFTNSISEGDTARASLEPLCQVATIFRAVRSLPWPGSAGVSVALLHYTRRQWLSLRELDGIPCRAISSSLTSEDVTLRPFALKSLPCQCFRGSDWNGEGFLIDDTIALTITAKEKSSQKFIFKCLNAKDYCDNPTQQAERSIIFFRDLTQEEANRSAPLLLETLRQRVYEERSRSPDARLRRLWWLFRRPTIELYDAAWKYESVFVVPFTSKYVCFGVVPARQVFANALNVFCGLGWDGFSVLQSMLHDAWVMRYCSRMETRIRYAPSDLFETFPFPSAASSERLIRLGRSYEAVRREIMHERQEGLTRIYNRFHDSDESAADIQRLRDLHVEMDKSVAAAYGWCDLELGHGFHETKQGMRFTISESARREVLARLLRLNHERYAEEVAQGLHEKRKGGKGRGKMKAANEADFPSLFS